MRRPVVVLGLIGALGAGAAMAATDPVDVEILVASGHAADARIAALSDRFLVVWTDSSGPSKDVLGRIYLSNSGEPLGPAFTVAGAAEDEILPVVSSRGDEFLVVWTRVVGTTTYGSTKTEMRAAQLSQAGAVLQSGGIVVVPAETPTCEDLSAEQVQIASNDIGWLIVWTEGCDGSEPRVMGSRISAGDGVALNAASFYLSNVCGNPHVASIGPNFLVTFDAYDPDTTNAHLIDVDGTILRRVELADSKLRIESIAGDGVNFRMTLREWPAISSVFIDGATLMVREETKELISGPTNPEYPNDHSSLTYVSDRWLIVREELGTAGPDVFFEDTRLFAGAQSPRITAAGDIALVTATRGGDVVARIFDVGHVASATPLPPAPTPTATPIATPTAIPPRDLDADGDGRGSARCSVTFGARAGSIIPAILACVLLMRRKRDHAAAQQ